MRIVIDTNVFMFALYFGGNPLKVVNLMQENRFDVFATPDIINEYNEVYYRLENKTGKKANKFVLDNILHYLKSSLTLIQSWLLEIKKMISFLIVQLTAKLYI